MGSKGCMQYMYLRWMADFEGKWCKLIGKYALRPMDGMGIPQQRNFVSKRREAPFCSDAMLFFFRKKNDCDMLLFERLFWGQVRHGRNVELFVNAAKLAGCCWNDILVSHDMSNVFYNAPQPNIQSIHWSTLYCMQTFQNQEKVNKLKQLGCFPKLDPDKLSSLP